MTTKALKSALVYATALLAPVAVAQPPDVGGLVNQVCSVSEQGIIGNVTIGDALKRLGIDPDSAFFFCSYSSLIQRAERMGNNFAGGMNSFVTSIGEELLVGTLDLLGTQIGAQGWAEDLNEQLSGANEQLNAAMQGLEQGSEGSLAAYRQALRGAFDAARESARESLHADIADPSRHAEGTQARIDAERLAQNPVLAGEVEALNDALLTAAEQRAESSAALAASEAAAGSYLGDTNFSDVVTGVIAPNDPTNPTATPGTATQLEEAATRATSTREAINELSRGFADYMRQDAILSASVIEGLRNSVQQQAITNWQLQQTAERELQKEYQRIEARQQQLRIELETSRAEIENVFGSLTDMIDVVNSGFSAEPLPEYCELVGGC